MRGTIKKKRIYKLSHLLWLQLLFFHHAFSKETASEVLGSGKKLRILLLPREQKDPKKPKLSTKAISEIAESFQKALLIDSSVQMNVLSQQETALLQSVSNKNSSLTERIINLIKKGQMDFQGVVEVSFQIETDTEDGKPKKVYELFFRFQSFADAKKSDFSFPLAPGQIYREKNGTFSLTDISNLGNFLATAIEGERNENQSALAHHSSQNSKESVANQILKDSDTKPNSSSSDIKIADTSDKPSSKGKSDQDSLQKNESVPTSAQNRPEETEDPLANLRKKPKNVGERYPWFSAFDIRAGYGYFTRRLFVEDREFLPYSAAHGLVLTGEIYPFAFVESLPKHLQGLGLRGSLFKPFWKDLQTVSAEGGPVTHTDHVQEMRGEFALHWRSRFFEKAFRPELELEVLYGYHSFGLESTDAKPTTIPSTAYHYLGGDVGGRIFLSRFVELGAGVAITKLLQLGPDIESMQNYGSGTGLMWRIRGDVGINLYGFTLGLRAFYEQNVLSFDGTGQKPISNLNTNPVRSALDDSIGFMTTIGYQFSPSRKAK